jgi:hypothetical protein
MKNSPTEARAVESFFENALSTDEIVALAAMTKQIWRLRHNRPPTFEQSSVALDEAVPGDVLPEMQSPLLFEA